MQLLAGMGSSKKRKEKAKDFAVSSRRVAAWQRRTLVLSATPQKAKLKLGKGKQKAANATDTSFSARCASTAPH